MSRRTELWQLLLAAAEPRSIADLADQLEVHPNTVRFHLDALLELGQVRRVRPRHRTAGRPPLLFEAVRRMDPDGPRRFQLLAEILADALADAPDARERAVQAGTAWWRRHAERFEADSDPAQAAAEEPVERLVGLLEDLGFAPEPPEPDRIDLRHCPFLELTATPTPARTDVICPIHLGLMQGALERWGASVGVESLDPLVEPDRCVAHLALRAAG